MDADEQKQLLDMLQNQLEKQIELARQGNYKQVELIAEENDDTLKRIVAQKTSTPEIFEKRRNHILTLYKKLEVMIAAEKSIVENQQHQADNVRKTLGIYRTSS